MDFSTGNHVIKFWAEWCGPCKAYAPIFKEAVATFKNVTVHDINIDDHSDIAQDYGLRGIPTTVFIKDGVVMHSKSGILQKEELEKLSQAFDENF